MELGGRAGFAASAATAGWERRGRWLLCCKPVVLIPVSACTMHWTSLPGAQTFQGSHVGKIIKLTMAILPPHHSAALHNCLLCLPQALTSSWELPWPGVAVQVWRLQCLCGGWEFRVRRKPYKTLGKPVFCLLPFQTGKKSCCSQLPLPAIVGRVWDWGRRLFLSWSMFFSRWKKNFNFLRSQSQTNNSLKKIS